MDDDAVLAEIWRRMAMEAAGAREASGKLPAPSAPSPSVGDAVSRLEQTVTIVTERERHEHRLFVLAELWCHFRGGDPEELANSLLAEGHSD